MAAAADMVRDMQMSIKRNSDDLKDELADLERWEAEMEAKDAARKKRAAVEPDLPPIRGMPKPAQPSKPKEDPVKVAKDEGNEYFRLTKFEEAVRAYTRGISHDPDASSSHVLYANRAMAYLKLQLWDLAERDATTCIQMNRTYAKAFYRRAVARRAMGKLVDARSDLQNVLVLSPGDAAAETEIKAVTSALAEQEKKSAAASGSAAKTAKKKKLVIEEVDDDDEDDAAASPAKASPSAAEKAKAAEAAAQEEAARKEAQLRDHEKARQAELARAQERAKAAAAEEAKRSKARQTHSRVEVIETSDDEEEPAKPEPAKPAPAKPAPAPQKAEEPKKTAAASASPTRSEDATSPKKPVHADPAPRKMTTAINAASLAEPKTFIDFERQYTDIMKKEPSLLSTYVAMIPRGRWRAVFGSSMTTEILADIFKATMALDGSACVDALCGAASVNRVSEALMMMDDDDLKVGRTVIGKATGAASEADKKTLRAFEGQF